MKSLLIDTSNQPLSVALMIDDKVIAEHTTNIKQNHSVQLMPAINRLFEQSSLNKSDLDSVIVAQGPGSYTGLRIGVTVAKTLAYALNANLYGVSSLAALAATMTKDESRLIVPVFDARREAVYAGVYQYQDQQLVTVMEDQYITIESLIDYLHQLKDTYVFVGEDTEKLASLLDSETIAQLPNATTMYHLIKEDKPEDLHTFTPNYHKLAEAERNWLNQQQNN